MPILNIYVNEDNVNCVALKSSNTFLHVSAPVLETVTEDQTPSSNNSETHSDSLQLTDGTSKQVTAPTLIEKNPPPRDEDSTSLKDNSKVHQEYLTLQMNSTLQRNNSAMHLYDPMKNNSTHHKNDAVLEDKDSTLLHDHSLIQTNYSTLLGNELTSPVKDSTVPVNNSINQQNVSINRNEDTISFIVDDSSIEMNYEAILNLNDDENVTFVFISGNNNTSNFTRNNSRPLNISILPAALPLLADPIR